MKVKVGNTITDSEHQPVMVILSEGDKENIINMDPKANRYCVYPDGEEWIKDNHKKIKDWMKIPSLLSPEKPEKGKIAVAKDWYKLLDKPCQSMWTDFGHPMCNKQFGCFLMDKNNSMTCPEGRKLKEDK